MASSPKLGLFGGGERDYLREASASRFAVSLWVPIFFGSIITSTGFLFGDVFHTKLNFHLLDFLTLPSSLIIFAIARAFRSSTGPSLLSNLAVWVLSAISATVFPIVIEFVVSGKINQGLASQWLVAIVSYTLNIALIANAYSGIQLGRARLDQLRMAQAQLSDSKESLNHQLDSMRGEIREGVDRELQKALTLFSTESESTPQQLSESILRAIDTVIRPLSHRLAEFTSGEAMPRPNFVKLRATKPRRGVALSRLAGPDIFAIAFLVFVLPAALTFQSSVNVWFLLLLLAIQIGLLVLIETKATRFHLNRGVGILLFTAEGAIFVPIYLAIAPGENSFGLAFAFVILSFVVSTLLALISKRVDTIQDQAQITEQLNSLVDQLRQEVWVTKTALAKAIHGSVQAKFLAIGLRLAQTAELTPDLVSLVKAEIRSCISDLSGSVQADSQSFKDHLNRFIEAWDDVVEIELQADSKSIEQLDLKPTVRSCVVEVLGEAIANSAKHSRSPNLKIHLAATDEGLLKLQVESQGKLSGETSKSGYGSQILNEVTSGWSLVEKSERVVLVADFALSS